MTTKQCGTRPKVLCIDDDPAITSAIERRLQGYEVDVLTAYFGTQGIWLAVTEHPDAIITDMRMPNGQGDYVVECLKKRDDTNKIPVVVLSGQKDCQTKQRMLALGVERYLQKPMTMDQVVDVLVKLIHLRAVSDDVADSVTVVVQLIRENDCSLKNGILSCGNSPPATG
jgi:response regulator RpfG family c-di-GMP phosphodiesterase